MKDTKVQWHPGFVAAMNLEFRENREDLIYEKEYNLNTKPLEIDLLVIKKETSVRIANEIGRFFRGHNIMEYKSPEDHLNIDGFYKSGAYASLYKSYGETVDEIKADDITVSIVREAKPVGLFQYLKEHGYSVSNPYKGIYHIKGKVLFPTQIIVSGVLDKDLHTWLRALSEKLEKDDIQEILIKANKLTDKTDREMADSVMYVAVKANKKTVEEMKGDAVMYEVLMEIMEPEIRVSRKEGLEEGLEEGIQGTVAILHQLGVEDEIILEKIQDEFQLSYEDAQGYLI